MPRGRAETIRGRCETTATTFESEAKGALSSVSPSSRATCIVLVGLVCSSCQLNRILYYNYPDLTSAALFDNDTISPSRDPLPLPPRPAEAIFTLSRAESEQYRSFDDLLARNDTGAFLVLCDGQVAYERYFKGITTATLLPCFSMTKTFAAGLIGCALEDGIMPPLNERVCAYIPELASRPGYEEITLEHLLRMTSGIDFCEESTDAALLYYCTDLRAVMYEYEVKWPPGTHYSYGSINVQLLWDVLHRRLGGRTTTSYFEERIWQPLGAEHPALWALDSRDSGIQKFFAGLSATARDYARFGLLVLRGGCRAERQVIPDRWLEDSLAPDPIAGTPGTSDGPVRRGKYQWTLPVEGRGFFCKGYLGQYIFIYPPTKAVVVRFGNGYGKVDWIPLFQRCAEQL